MRRAAGAAVRLMLSLALIVWPVGPGVGVRSAQAASVPTLMNYQGRLTDSSNNPLSGANNFFFEVYDAPTGGSQLWSEVQNGVSVANGVFNVELGAATPLPPGVFASGTAYLQVTVNGTTLTPRQRLITAPFAFSAQQLQGRDYTAFVSTDSSAQSIAGDKTFTGTLTVPTPTAPGHAATKAYVDAALGQSGLLSSTSTWTGQNTFTNLVTISSAVAVSGAPGAFSLTASSGVDVAAGGVYAPFFSGAFFGDGSRLTGVSGSDPTKVAKTGDTMTGQLTLAGSTLTVGGSAFSVGGSTLVVSAGTVGVGTTSAAGKLTVAQSNSLVTGTPALALENPNAASGQTVESFTFGGAQKGSLRADFAGNVALSAFGGSMYYGLDGTSVSHRFYVNGSETERIDGSGRLGVGTTSPQTPLDVDGSAQFGAGVAKSTFTSAGALDLAFNAALTGTSSVTASAFFGDGSHLSGVVSSDNTKVAKSGDTMTGQLTLAGSTLTVTGDAFSVGGATFAVTGGRVGLGTTSPAAQLHLQDVGGSGNSLRLNAGSSFASIDSRGANLLIQVGGASAFTLNASQIVAQHDLVMSNGSDNAVLETSGALGLGTTTPAGRLHVSSGAVIIDGTGGQLQFGDGSVQTTAFTGAGTDGTKVSKAGDTMTGQLTLSGSTLTVRSNGGVSPLLVTTTTTAGYAGLFVDGSDRVGIGTTAPDTALDINDATGWKVQTGADSIRLAHAKTGTFQLDGSYAALDVLGSLGVNNGSPSLPLDVEGGAQFGSGVAKSTFTSAGALALAFNAALTGTSSVTASAFFGDGSHLTNIASDASKVSKAGDAMSGQLTIQGSSLTVRSNAASSPLYVSTSAVPGSVGLYLDAGNNVGVGTTAPGARFDVAVEQPGDGARVTGGGLNSPSYTLYNGGTKGATLGLTLNSGNFSQHAAPGDVVLRNENASGSLILSAGGQERLWVQSGGNVGVGTTSPAAALDVAGSAHFSGNVPLDVTSQGLHVGWNQQTGAMGETDLVNNQGFGQGGFVFALADGTGVIQSTPVFVSGGGSVGMGTTSPQERLDVDGAAQFGSGVAKSTFTTSGALNLAFNAALAATSSVTASAFFGDGSHLTGISGLLTGGSAGTVPVWLGSSTLGLSHIVDLNSPVVSATMTVQGSAFSVGGSTLVVSAGEVGIGTTAPDTALDINDATGWKVQTGADSIRLAHAKTGTFQLDGSYAALDVLGSLGVNNGSPSLPLDVEGGAQFGSGVAKSTFTSAGALDLAFNAALTGTSSVTASAFFGDGSHLTNIASDASKVSKAGDSMTGQLTIQGSSLTVRSNAASSPLYVSTSPTPGVVGLYVDGANDVGVGTESPQRLLDVAIQRPGDGVSVTGGGIDSPAYELFDGATHGATLGLTLSSGHFSQNAQPGDVVLRNENAAGNLILNAGGQERLYIQPGGKVGVGTTSPTAELDVAGNGRFAGNVAPDLTQQGAYIAWNQQTGAMGETDLVNNRGFGQGGFVFALADGSGVVQSTPVFVSGGGNVGIGTTSPAAKLHMSSGTLLLDGAGAQLEFADGTVQTTAFNGGTGFVLKAGDTMTGELTIDGSSLTVRTDNPMSPLYISTSPTPGVVGLYVDENNDVGVGTTSPQRLFDVAIQRPGDGMSITGGGIFSPAYTLFDGATQGATLGLTLNSGNFSQHAQPGDVVLRNENASGNLILNAGGQERLYIQPGGKVGVGTTSPTAELDVAGNGRFAGNVAPDLSQQGAHIAWNQQTGAMGETDLVNNRGGGQGGFVFALADGTGVVQSTPVFVSGGGSVGIGTTSPAAKLHMSSGTLLLDGAGAQLEFADGSVQTTAFTGGSGYVQKTGDAMTGQLTIVSSETVEGALGVGVVDAADGTLVVQSTSTLGASPVADFRDHNGSSLLRVQEGGAVGIGTTSPAGALDVDAGTAGGGAPDLELLVSTLTSTDAFGLGFATSNGRKLTVQSRQGTYQQAMVFGDAGAAGTETVFGLAASGDSGSTWSPLLAVKQSGQVGIGTSSPAGRLHVSSGSVIIDGAGGQLQFGDGSVQTTAFTGTASDNTKVAKSGDTMTGQLTISGSSETIIDANVGPGADAFELAATTASDRSVYHFVVSTTGAVGIDNPAPAYPLDVHALASGFPINAVSGDHELLRLESTNPASEGWLSVNLAAGSAPFRIRTNNSVPVTLDPGGSEHMRVTAAGDVGIGTTSPQTPLDVEGAAQFGSGVTKSTFTAGGDLDVAKGITAGSGHFNVDPANGNISDPNGVVMGISDALDVISNSASNQYSLRVGTSATDTTVFVSTTGWVGIGTTTPAAKLHMSSGTLLLDGSGAGVEFPDGSVQTTAFTGSASDNTKVAKTGDTMTGQLTLAGSTLTVTGDAFSVGGSTLVVASGDVGIGTSSPSAPLHVLAPAAASEAVIVTTGTDAAASLLTLSSKGVLSVGGAPGWQGAPSFYDGAAITDTGGDLNLVDIEPTITANAGSPFFGAYDTDLTVNGSANVGGVAGVVSNPSYAGTGAIPSAVLNGYAGAVYGVGATPTLASGASPAVVGVFSKPSSGGAAGAAYGVFVGAAAKTGGSLDNAYGVLIETQTAGAVNYQLFSEGASPFVVTGAGEVGIGTSSPAAKLHMSSGTLLLDGAGAQLEFADGSVQTTAFTGTASDGTKVSKAGDTMTGQLTLAGSTLTVTGDAFSVGGSTFVVASGEVGVGTTAPAARLEVDSLDASTTASIVAAAAGQTADLTQWRDSGGAALLAVGAAGNLSWPAGNGGQVAYDGSQVSVSNQGVAVFQGNGGSSVIGNGVPALPRGVYVHNVGAGRQPLVVDGSPAQTADLTEWRDGSGAILAAVSASGGLAVSTAAVTGDAFSVGGSTLAASGGRVGIGTASPAAKLHVSSGTLLIDGDAAKPFQVGTSSFVVDGADGFVGINRGAPVAQLHVAGRDLSSNAEIAIQGANTAGGTQGVQFLYNSTLSSKAGYIGSISQAGGGGTLVFEPALNATTQNEAMRIAPNGDVGIGTTSPAGRLHVSSGTVIIDGTGGALQFPDGSVQTTAAGSSLWTANGADTYESNTTGNVGIGTTGPSDKLDVLGSATGPVKADVRNTSSGTGDYAQVAVGSDLRDNTAVITALSSGFTSDGLNLPDGAAFQGTGSGGLSVAANNASGALRFYSGGPSERMRVDAQGRVGIGATVPAARLQVSSANATSADTVFEVSSGTAGGQELLVVKGDGKVGIGTANPTENLRIEGSQPYLKLVNTSGNVGPGIRLQQSGEAGGKEWALFSNGSGNQGGLGSLQVYDWTDNTVPLLIQPGGNVGIGVTNPSTALDVETPVTLGSNVDALTIAGTNAGTETLDTTVGLNFNLRSPTPGSNWTYGAIRAGEDSGTGQINGSLRFLTQKYSGGSVLTEAMRIDHDGNVGIGTTSPAGRLDVRGGTAASGAGTPVVLSAQAGASAANGGNIVLNAGANGAGASNGSIIFANGASSISGGVPTSESMRIDPTGNVGIGTTNPGAQLEATGEVKADGGVWVPRRSVPSGTCDSGHIGRQLVSDGNYTIGDPIVQACATGGATYDTHMYYCGTRWNGSAYVTGWVCLD